LKLYKHLFFDLDNTLWDFKANAREAFSDIFNKLGLFAGIPDLNKFLLIYEKYNEHLWSEYRKGNVKKDYLRSERIVLAFKEMGIDDPVLSRQVAEQYVNIAPQKANLFPGVHETLRYLYSRYKLYILTNGFAEVQVQKVNNCGIQVYFTKLFMAEMVGYQKPDKRFFEYAIKSVHAHKNECLMIGDDIETDIKGALNAGIDQVYFNPGKIKCAIQPTCEIDSIASLMKIL
jgi:putative hydrolase of the HAD superfamily